MYVDFLWMGRPLLTRGTFFLGKIFWGSKVFQKFSRGFKTFFFPNFYDSFFNDHSSGIFQKKKGTRKNKK
jgi:hypothetical protein